MAGSNKQLQVVQTADYVIDNVEINNLYYIYDYSNVTCNSLSLEVVVWLISERFKKYIKPMWFVFTIWTLVEVAMT